MRRLFVVGALLLMMLGLDALKATEMGYGNPLTLAAIGFVVLAAFAIAELGGRLSLPKVTGYILSGVVLGPFAADVLSQNVVEDMTMFSTLALGLIATTAGLELDLKALAKLARTLGSTVGIKLVTGLLFVGGTVLALGMWTPALEGMGFEQLLALGLVFAALSLGTSPAIALAVASESKAKGRLTDLVLGAAIVKDVVVVVALAIALATGNALLGGGELGISVLVHVGEELGASVLAGSLLGGLLIAYLRWIKTEMLLFVTAMVLVVAEVSAALHLELLLVFIVAGVVVRNFSKFEHELLHPLETVSLPVFIVFFTTAGAKVDLLATWGVLPIALAICGARAVGYVVAGQLGGRIGKEPAPVRKLAWLGYLPQAGVTLGLVGLATNSLPEELSATIATLGMAVVAVNLLVGPISLRVALRMAGEIGSAAEAVEEQAAPEELVGPNLDRLESGRLRTLAASVREAHLEVWAKWSRDAMAPALAELTRQLETDDEASSSAELVLERLERIRPGRWKLELSQLRAVLQRHTRLSGDLRVIESVPLEASLASVARGDAFIVRVRKRLAALASVFRKQRTRQVPVRLAVRTAFEPRMVALAEQIQRQWQRHQAACLATMQRAVLGTCSWPDASREFAELAKVFTGVIAEDQTAAVDAATRELVETFATIGAPGGGGPKVKFSRVERDIEASLERLSADNAAWPERRKAAMALLGLVGAVERAQTKLQTRLGKDVAKPLDDAFDTLQHEVAEELNRLGTIVVPEEPPDDEQWERIGLQVGAVLTKPAAKQIRNAFTRVRKATSTSSPFAALMGFVNDGEDKISIVPTLAELIAAPRPARVDVVSVNVRELKEVQISDRLLPSVEQRLTRVSEEFSAARDTMHEAATLLEFGYQTAAKSRTDEEENATAGLTEALRRARGMLEALPEGRCQAWSGIREEIRGDIDDMATRLLEAVVAVATGQRSEVDALPSATQRARQGIARARQWLRVRTEALRAAVAGGTAGDLAQRYRLRASGAKLDAQSLRAVLEEQRSRRKPGVEGLYASLFTSQPLRDPRLFAIHREQLAAVVRAERAWQAASSRGNGALVVGGVGSGKSSTLVIAQLKLSTRRIIQVRRRTELGSSLWEGLGRVLDVGGRRASVSEALGTGRAVVIVDDLHRWFAPTAAGLAAFEEFLDFVAKHGEQVFWLVSMSSEALEQWRAVVPIEHAFGCLVRLGDVSAEELDKVLEARHALSGMEVVLPSTWRGDVGQRFFRRSPRAMFCNELEDASRRNLRRAVGLWLTHARPVEEAIEVDPVNGVAWALPFVARLQPSVLTVLATLLRHGPCDVATMRDSTGLPESALAQAVRFTAATSLISETPEGSWELDPKFIDDVAEGLTDAGLLRGGAQ